jgi:hypothetical protein
VKEREKDMNKYFLPVAATAVAGVVLLGACNDGGAKPAAQLKGSVVGKHIEKCDIEMMAFEAGSGGGKGGSRKAPSNSGTSNNTPKAPPVDMTKPTKVPTPTLVPPTSYPPQKSGSTGGKGKSCKMEHELEINTGEGVFEEDVTAEVYGLCDEGEKYPACREGK